MRRTLFFIFVLILLIGNAQAVLKIVKTPPPSKIIATIGTKGLSMANPEAAEAVNNIICLSNPIACVEGRIISQVYGEALQALAETSPEAAKAVSVYNELKELGIEIPKDSEAEITDKGEIQFSGEGQVNIGKLVSENFDEEDVSVNGILVSKDAYESTLTFIDDEKGKVCIKENCFENIQSQETSRHPTFLKLDKEGDIIKADFTTNEKGGIYNLGGSSFNVPPNSRVQYTKEDSLQLPENTEITEIRDIGKITGENIKLPTGQILNGGTLSYENGKIFVKKGDEAIIDTTKFLKTDNDVYFYSDKKFMQDEHQQENYYYERDKEIIIHSTEKGKVKTEFLAGNDFFNMNKAKYELDDKGNPIKFGLGDEKQGFLKDKWGYKYKSVPDEKDFFRISVEKGDMIKMEEGKESHRFLFFGEKRKEKPLITHTRAENGETFIESGRTKFELADELYYDTKFSTNQEEFDRIREGKYQSVSFQLQSDSIPQNYQLRMGNNNQFALISPDEKDARVVFSKYGVAISKYQGEQPQTIEQLKAKYAERGIDFGLVGELSDLQKAFGVEPLITKNYKEPSPLIIQVADQWLEEHPEADLDYITFSDIANAAYPDLTRVDSDKVGFFIGEQVIDPESAKSIFSMQESRNMKYPLTTLTHEYEHLMDDKIDDLEFKEVQKKVRGIKIEQGSLWKESVEYAKTTVDKNNLGKVEYMEFQIYPVEESFEELQKKKSEYENKKKIFEEQGYEAVVEIDEELKKSEESGGHVSEEYVKRYLDASVKFYNDQILEKEIFNEKEALLGRLEKEGADIMTIDETLSKTLLKNPKFEGYLREQVYDWRVETNARKYVANELLKDDSQKPLLEFYNKIAIDASETLKEDAEFKIMYGKIIETIKKEKNKFKEKLKERADRQIEYYEKDGINFDWVYASSGYKEKEINNLYRELEDYAEEKTGIPTLYALINYGEMGTPLLAYNPDQYSELTSTYREESIFERRKKMYEGTPTQRDVYYKMTQLAFDSGKMPVKEYKQLMGDDYCERLSCCDKKCVIYKLHCVGKC